MHNIRLQMIIPLLLECVLGEGRDVLNVRDGETVTITSPNFPDNYNVDETVEWNLQADEPGSWLRVEIGSFNASSFSSQAFQPKIK